MTMLFKGNVPIFNSLSKLSFGDVPDDCPSGPGICDIDTDPIDVFFDGINDCVCDFTRFACCFYSVGGGGSCSSSLNGNTFRCTWSVGLGSWVFQGTSEGKCIAFPAIGDRIVLVTKSGCPSSPVITVVAGVVISGSSTINCRCFAGFSDPAPPFPSGIDNGLLVGNCCSGVVGSSIRSGYDGTATVTQV